MERDLYCGRQLRFHADQLQFLQHRRDAFAGASSEFAGDARVLADGAELGDLRLFAGGLASSPGEPTPGSPAASLPGFLSGNPIGALVVGGSAASNPTATISLAGSNNGSNLRVARNIFTYNDNVAVTKGVHQLSLGVSFQRLESNEMNALSQYGQDTFTSLQTFMQGVGTLLFDPTPTPLGWRTTMGAIYATDT